MTERKRIRTTKKTGKKSALTVIKEWLSEEDARTVLALIMVIGGLAIMFVSIIYGAANVAVPSMSALMLLVLEWYFIAKRDERR